MQVHLRGEGCVVTALSIRFIGVLKGQHDQRALKVILGVVLAKYADRFLDVHQTIVPTGTRAVNQRA